MLSQRHVMHVEGDGMFMERHVIWGEHVMFKGRARLQPCR